MARKKRGSNGTQTLAYVLLLVGATTLGALAYYVQNTPQAARVPAAIRRDAPSPQVQAGRDVVIREVPFAVLPEDKEGAVRVAKLEGDEIKLAGKASVPQGSTAVQTAVQETVRAMNVPSRVLGVEVIERVARLHMSPDIEAGMGSAQEAQLVKALQVALGQFKGVDSFQLFVEGRQVESLGHFELEPTTPVVREP